MMDRSLKLKADVAQIQEIERGVMDIMADHVSIIHNKLGQAEKAKNTMATQQKANREFQDFVIEQLAELGVGNTHN
jgi:oligoribonuclease (3'-5' exoribonuclease)